MKLKTYTYSWRISGAKISLIPDIGFYRKRRRVYIQWLGVLLHINF